MSKNKVVLRFEDLTFEYLYKKPVLKEASFSIHEGDKITLMGQNGAGKTTIFKLITEELKPKEGSVFVDQNAKVAIARQVMEQKELELSVKQYFEQTFDEVPYNVDKKIAEVMEVVNLQVPSDKLIKDLSGGQQARLLLAYALIQNPDILLLDEPTNNLDSEGIDHLIQFLIMYEKTVLVISHDADFLNCFTEGVIYLDFYTKQVEKYVGDYYSVVEEIESRIKRERMKNAQLLKDIQDKKEKINYFAYKGGKMRKLAKKMRDEVEQNEENMVDVRKEDKTIRDFEIPVQDIVGKIVEIKKVFALKNGEIKEKEVDIVLSKNTHLLVSGPNGAGKSTFINSLLKQKIEENKIMEGTRISYYSQDFAGLDFSKTVMQTLTDVVSYELSESDIRSVAAGFLLYGDAMEKEVGVLSEGQKGLLTFACFVLQKPGLLILDEPSNHINFRHLPVIAEAVSNYKGAMIVVSHMKEFVDKIKINEYLDLGNF